MTDAFLLATALTELDVSTWDTSAVVHMNSTFNKARGLTRLDLSGWDTANVIEMTGLFLYATALESLDVAGWDTGNVREMNVTFGGAESLTRLDLSGWDTRQVVEMTDMLALLGNASELVLGPLVVLHDDAHLPDPRQGDALTGAWVEVGEGSVTVPHGPWNGTAASLVEQSAAGTGGTYVWQENVTVAFDANGGAGSLPSLAGVTGAPITIGENGFERDGAAFTAWNSRADGSGASYAPQDAVYLPGGASTLFAQWDVDAPAPAPSPAPAPPTTTVDGGLAQTGANVASLAALGALALVAGALLLRRRTRSRA